MELLLRAHSTEFASLSIDSPPGGMLFEAFSAPFRPGILNERASGQDVEWKKKASLILFTCRKASFVERRVARRAAAT